MTTVQDTIGLLGLSSAFSFCRAGPKGHDQALSITMQPSTEWVQKDFALQAVIYSCHRVFIISRLKTHVGGFEISNFSHWVFSSFSKYKFRKPRLFGVVAILQG